MTYNEFVNGNFKRTILKYPNYVIDNKGNVFNAKTGYKLKRLGNRVGISTKTGNKNLTVTKEILKAFPDVEFTEDDYKIFTTRNIRKRGIYPWNLGKNKWRAVISQNNEKITIGYYKTKEEAYKAFSEAFMKLRGYRSW